MNEKIQKYIPQTLFKALPQSDQDFLLEQSEIWPLSFQQFKQLVDVSKDLSMWQQGSLKSLWPTPQMAQSKTPNKEATSKLVNEILDQWNLLKNQPKDYTNFKTSKATFSPGKYNFGQIDSKDKILGRCPVASERTLCCNLLTLDAVRSCGFDCSYCSIQSFFTEDKIQVEQNLKDKLDNLSLDPNNFYHIGTGQSSDSLMWGNKDGILDDLCEFADENPNVILELKTKSKNIGYLLNNPIPKNILCTWSLNPQSVANFEERYTASVKDRIGAARRVADKGLLVGFHFHPIIYTSDFETAYQKLAQQLIESFSPKEVALISMGTITFTKSVIKKIRKRDLASKILQMPLQEADGKLSYSPEIKLKLFKNVYQALSPWHQKVFFYLCMENRQYWKPLFGYEYKDNLEFEAAMKSSYHSKITQLKQESKIEQ